MAQKFWPEPDLQRTAISLMDVATHREIPLTQGFVALVDEADFERVSSLKWHAKRAGKHVYACAWDGGQSVSMHRYILRPEETQQVDHANHDGLDNRRSNIRVCTPAQNSANSRRAMTRTSRGVERVRDNGHIARIVCGNEARYLGYFKTEIEAAYAYNVAAVALHGEFATLNEISWPELRAALESALADLQIQATRIAKQLESIP